MSACEPVTVEEGSGGLGRTALIGAGVLAVGAFVVLRGRGDGQ